MFCYSPTLDIPIRADGKKMRFGTFLSITLAILDQFEKIQVSLKAGQTGYEIYKYDFARKTDCFRDIFKNVWNI